MSAVEDFFGALDRAAESSKQPVARLAIVYSSHSAGQSSARVRFDGETEWTTKAYPSLSSYTPVANDRVLMLPAGDSYVILGAVAT